MRTTGAHGNALDAKRQIEYSLIVNICV
jgi:hypothetical protein